MPRILSLAALIISFFTIGLVLYEFGFPIDHVTKESLHASHKLILITLWIIITFRWAFNRPIPPNRKNRWVQSIGYGLFSVVTILSLLLGYGVISADAMTDFITANWVVVIIISLVSIYEISGAVTIVLNSHTNPATILAGSFALIILIGSLLLQLPNCTTEQLSYIDSLFISTSAVCVTGLSPVDVSQIFTVYGQIIIMLLIQIGGLGIMTITSFFGLFYAGGGSLSNRAMIKELLSGDSLNGLMRLLIRIIVVTFCVELVGAILIFITIHDTAGIDNPVFFSIFHSVSAFCNAGFSTLSGGLYDPLVRNMGSVMWIISFLVIFGGIGFPIFSNLLSSAWHHIQNVMRRILGIRRVYKPHLWNLNSYIVIKITMSLLLVSWGLFLVLEWNNSLAEYNTWDKLAQGFLCAVTPRTAGFNGVDLSTMLPASIALTILLMWIGGAPQSTAGGVKVTTVYLAIKNIFSSTADNKIEVHNRTIPNNSVRRAFGIITLSLSIIAVSIIILAALEPEIELSKLIFEVFSAIGTVGLSLELTPELGTGAKILIMLLMFIGRVGIITILSLFMNRSPHKPYSYPEENILIN